MKLHSSIMGKGKPILILHGLYGSSDNWLTIAKGLSSSFEVHLIDLRNHGNSPHSSEHNYPVMAKDIKEYLDARNIKKIILLGHSMGGKVAMLFTLTHPEYIEKLIVADIAPKNYPRNYDGHIEILNAMQNIDLPSLKTRKEVEKQLHTVLTSKKVTQLIMKNLYRKKDKSFAWRIHLSALHENLDKITGGTDDWSEKKTKAPTLFIKGEHSHYLSLDDDFLIRKSFEKSELTVIPNAGHWLHAEQTELMLKTILYFIK